MNSKTHSPYCATNDPEDIGGEPAAASSSLLDGAMSALPPKADKSCRGQAECRRRSPLLGNGISRAEKKALIRRPNHRSAVSETKRSFKNPADSGAFRTPAGNLRECGTAWWAWEDSNLQPTDYAASHPM